MDFLNHREGGIVFYQVFLLSPLQKLKRLRGIEEIEISSKVVVVTVEEKERRKTLKTFVWISSKNSASGKQVFPV
jgi:hypothetical protein